MHERHGLKPLAVGERDDGRPVGGRHVEGEDGADPALESVHACPGDLIVGGAGHDRHDRGRFGAAEGKGEPAIRGGVRFDVVGPPAGETRDGTHRREKPRPGEGDADR